MRPLLDLPTARPMLRGPAGVRAMVAAQVAVDAATLVACALAAMAFAGAGAVSVDSAAVAWALPAPFVIAYAAMGLYPGIGLDAGEELRRLTVASIVVFLALATALLMSGAPAPSAGAFVGGAGLTLVAVPTVRGLLRRLCARRRWWGVPAVVIGSGQSAGELMRRLLARPMLGIKPIAVIDDAAGGDAGAAIRSLRLPYAIVALPGDPAAATRLIDRYGRRYRRLIVVPELFGQLIGVASRDVGGVLGLEVEQRLLRRGARRAKRLTDLAVGIPLAVAALPLMALLAALVRLDSRGPALYAQTRVGQGGRRFRTWKFRSMVEGADDLLDAHLERDPAAADEWRRDRKLARDPRVTRIGRFLRRTSLDELPQLWNVLRGDMSLIGPRPIVPAEVPRYLDRFRLYGKIKPGLTGLWQVSGRSDTSYDVRIELDAYYARNWSPWLDLHILAKTAFVVLVGRGAR